MSVCMSSHTMGGTNTRTCHTLVVSLTLVVMFPSWTGSLCISFKLTILYDFLVTVKAAPHECVIGTGQP